jgi:hypothetical protein
MQRLRITVLDLVSKGPARKAFARVMNANLASIMPQVIAVWCEELGREVRFVCYTGFEDLSAELLDDTDVLFVGAFTRSAQLAYAISNLYRRRHVGGVIEAASSLLFANDRPFREQCAVGVCAVRSRWAGSSATSNGRSCARRRPIAARKSRSPSRE